jgi:hypothetical protein
MSAFWKEAPIMEHVQLFAEVLEAVDRLSLDEQETLVAIVQRRMAERGRKLLAVDVQDARREFATGLCRPSSADELMNEILS